MSDSDGEPPTEEPSKGLKEGLEEAVTSLEAATDKAAESARSNVLDRPAEEDHEARMWALAAHLSPLVLAVLGPLIVWLIKKDESAYIADQAKEALNFSVTMTVLTFAIVAVGFCLYFPFVLLPVVWALALVLHVFAAMAANEGKWYRYPVNVRLVK